jgi:hypothetical protein
MSTYKVDQQRCHQRAPISQVNSTVDLMDKINNMAGKAVIQVVSNMVEITKEVTNKAVNRTTKMRSWRNSL